MTQDAINLIIGGAISLSSICLTSIVTLLAIFVSNYFQRKSDERKRKWELEDRELNIRFAVKNKKITDAQEYVSIHMDVSQILLRFQVGMLTGEDVEQYRMDFEKLPELIKRQSKLVANFMLLNDLELWNLDGELRYLYHTEENHANELMLAIKNDKTLALDKGALFERVEAFTVMSTKLIGKIQRRLDELAKTMY